MRTILFLFAIIFIISCDNKKPAEIKSTPSENFETTSATPINPDSIAFSFVFMGCNRIEKDDKDSSGTNASTANVPELKRTFNEIAALNPKPVFYFFLGDEVLGLENDTTHLSKQLIAWRNQYLSDTFSNLHKSGIQLVAIPGNHEMLYEKKNKEGKKEEVPNPSALQTYMNQMGAFMPSGPVTHYSGPDGHDNRMTYSFTYQNTHFILMNTDTYNKSGKIGMAPKKWIKDDIKAAGENKSIKHIFLLGHKPAVLDSPLYHHDGHDGDKIMHLSVVNEIWPEMGKYHVEAMLSAHSHQYDRLQPSPDSSYQIIAGNGGSLYESKADSSLDRQFFGYCIIYIMKNGQVILVSKGRTMPFAKYMNPVPDTLQTTTRDSVNISWGTREGIWVPKPNTGN